MDTLTNAIIVKIQKTLNCETCASDAELVRKITRAIVNLSAGEKKLILMTMTTTQVCEKFGK